MMQMMQMWEILCCENAGAARSWAARPQGIAESDNLIQLLLSNPKSASPCPFLAPESFSKQAMIFAIRISGLKPMIKLWQLWPVDVCSKILQTPNMSKLFPEPGLSEETRTRVAWRRETSCQKSPKGLVPALRHTWRLLFGKWGTSHVMPQVQLPCQYVSMLYSYLLIVWTSNLHVWVVSKESVKLSKRCTEALKVQEGVRHFRPEAEMASDIAARRHVWAQNTVCQTDIQSLNDSCAHRATLRKSQGRSTS
jgi:hypothetical protein